MAMPIELSAAAAAKVRAAAAARGVAPEVVVEELIDRTLPAIEGLDDDGGDALEAFFGCGDSGDPDWAGTDTKLLRTTI
jgi:hypothetical protein